MAELITVPTFTYNQGSVYKGDENTERPITVNYYNGSIELQQEGEYDQPESIIIQPDHIDKLFKEIKKHLPEATLKLNQ